MKVEYCKHCGDAGAHVAVKKIIKLEKWIEKQNKDMHRMCESEKDYLETIARLDGELKLYKIFVEEVKSYLNWKIYDKLLNELKP